LPFPTSSRFDALRLLKALSLSKGASPERLADFVIMKRGHLILVVALLATCLFGADSTSRF
jgi:hypothetical protein